MEREFYMEENEDQEGIASWFKGRQNNAKLRKDERNVERRKC